MRGIRLGLALVMILAIGALGLTWAQSSTKSDATSSTSAGYYTSKQAKTGAQLYVQHCQVCHGDKLQGAVGPSLVGSNFEKKWESGSLTVDDLFYIMSTTMPKAQPGSLKTEQYINLIAYLLEQNGYPAGKTALPSDESALQKLPLKVQQAAASQ